ncbi:rhodanese-like domain-containing protein [Kribbella sp. NPDC050459]|uniref:rhodanese-like domain-containing protein n=1 Tax=Kribbella sp. NPDC050459 TaxID=3155785 RepID=UPI0033D1D9B6
MWSDSAGPGPPRPCGAADMTRDELTKRLQAGDLDIRPAPEYASGHLPGAVSLPIDQLRERLDEVRGGGSAGRTPAVTLRWLRLATPWTGSGQRGW